MLKETQHSKCSNPDCERTFSNPLIIRCCPYCRTEIKDLRAGAHSGKCKYYFGYLSERSKREKITEDCVTCEKTVECMLAKLRKTDDAIKEIKKWYK
jgi:hypothetical protein